MTCRNVLILGPRMSCANNMLFLLDEALAGTNSNDRCFGASAVIEQLIGSVSVGLVTHHDLALTEAVNVHDGGTLKNTTRVVKCSSITECVQEC